MSDDNNIITDDERDGQEIDLLELAAKLWQGRRTIFKYCGVAAVIGLVVAFSIPKEYTATIKLAPELGGAASSVGGGLASLASAAGLGGSVKNGDAVLPELYSDVLGSVPFSVGLFDVPVKESKTDSIYTVREYLTDHTSAPWWSAVLSLPGKAIGGMVSLFKDDDEADSNAKTDPFRLNMEEEKVRLALSSRVSCDYDTKTGVNTITISMQDPLVSAMLADTVAAHLQAFVTDYRTSKARKDLVYAEGINNEARDSYYAAQQRLADYLDRNQGLSLHSSQVTRERLTNEASLAFSLFNQTAQQLQMAKAKVQENTPVFAVVEPATVPVKADKPKKMVILIGFIFLGAVVASVKILFGDTIKDFRNKALLSDNDSASSADMQPKADA